MSVLGAVALAEFIADSPRLVRLDLRENSIKTAGLMALALSLKVNTTVTKLDLDKELKRELVRVAITATTVANGNADSGSNSGARNFKKIPLWFPLSN